MIPKECKRLAEVDFPIAVVSKHAAREKSIRHGHPSTLHLWWARRPLAACRSMLMALLLPDPCDPHCPAKFKKEARRLLLKTRSNIDGDDLGLRQAILKFIGDFANWDLSADATYLEAARGLIKAAHGEETPLVVDPFAGGGSIPLEALRLGCDAFASDLNPVACLILKVMLEDIPRQGSALAGEMQCAGADIKRVADQQLAEFYPRDPDGAIPIAYLWARTVRCESPKCGAQIPLVRSFWLSKKAKARWALRYAIDRRSKGSTRVEFEVFQPKVDKDVPNGTVARAKATCPCCGAVLAPDRVRDQLAAQSGGADVIFDELGHRIGGARLLSVVIASGDKDTKGYRQAEVYDYLAVWNAKRRLREVFAPPDSSDPALPDEQTPVGGGSGAGRAFSLQRYGVMKFADLFTSRQKLTLLAHASAIRQFATSSDATRHTVARALAPSISKLADTNSVICTWQTEPPRLRATFSRQALSTTWDFAEASPLGRGAGNYDLCVKAIAEVIERSKAGNGGAVEQADARESPLPTDAVGVWFTDPPYYDAVPYAELSDFFFSWLKRALPSHLLFHDRFDPSNRLTPKDRELVQDETKYFEGKRKDRAFFESAMARVFSEGWRILENNGIGCVVFAHKTTEGWEALLSGMVRGGWTITASWPISTELESRQRARDSAALATSVHLVCRPRPEDAPIGDWADVLRELPRRVGDWMERLQGERIRGADLVFACIGPALEIYSRYSKVVDPQEREIPLGGDPQAKEPHLRGYLAYVWEIVGRIALEQVLGTAEAKARNGAAGALEEDARLTALFLWTIQATPVDNGSGNGDTSEDGSDADGGESEDDSPHPGPLPEGEGDDSPKRKSKGLSLIYDVVRRFAQPLGIHLEQWDGRIIETEKGVVRLIPVLDRAEQLFGEAGASLTADRIEAQAKRNPQAAFDFMVPESAVPEIKGRGKRKPSTPSPPAPLPEGEGSLSHRGATTLDRVHAAMLLQSSGRTNALRALLKSELDRGPDFVRLANALSALYPKESDEKRLLDAMLLAVPR